MERDFQTLLNHWFKSIFYKTAAFELKVTPTNSLPFSAVKDHQEAALYAAKHANLFVKIPDLGNKNPCDAIGLVMVPAYVVVMFRSKDAGQKEFFLIEIDTWLREKEFSSRKSLTEERAREIGKACSLG